jgi:hypothetical protein
VTDGIIPQFKPNADVDPDTGLDDSGSSPTYKPNTLLVRLPENRFREPGLGSGQNRYKCYISCGVDRLFRLGMPML